MGFIIGLIIQHQPKNNDNQSSTTNPPSYLLDYKIEVSSIDMAQNNQSFRQAPTTESLPNNQGSLGINLFDRVLVQVGKRELIGFVVAKDVTVDYDVSKVKLITKYLDSPLSQDVQKLVRWLAQYYCCDLYSAIRLALPNDYFKNEIVTPKQEVYIFKNQSPADHKLTAKQQEVLDEFAEGNCS